MKVLHVIPSMAPGRGGPAVVLRQMMAGLSARGVSVDVATTDSPETPRQIEFYSFSWPLRTWLKRHIRDYDVIHIHALFNFPATVAARIARRAGVPYIIRPLGTLSPWGLENRRPGLKMWSLEFIEKPTLRGAAAVHATSEQERAEILAVCPECRVVVIPNPVEMPDEPLARPQGRPSTILFLSRIDRKKGLDLLIAAFERCEGDLRLVIAGGGEPLPAGERVRFLGEVGAEQKRQLFAEADLFALTSHSENFGVAVVEAMAHGVPVLISPNVGIAPDVAAADAGGVVVCEVDAIAQAIRELMSDPARLAQMGRNGRKLAMERYSPGLVADQLIAMYEGAR